MTAARCGICGATTAPAEVRNVGRRRPVPLVIDCAPGCAGSLCRHTVGPTLCRAGAFDVRIIEPVDVVPGQITVGFHRVEFPELVDGDGRPKRSLILCGSIVELPELVDDGDRA